MIEDTEKSNEASLKDFSAKFDAMDKSVLPPPNRERPPPWSTKSLSTVERKISKGLGWFFGFYWVVWITYVMIGFFPTTLVDWFVVPFSAFICWLVYRFHLAIALVAVRTLRKKR